MIRLSNNDQSTGSAGTGPEGFVQQTTVNRVFNIHKPVGWTSFDVVRWLKGRLRMSRVGHAGTLDPFADGVLLVCAGQATRQVPALMSAEKEYVAELQLGIETDTLDVTGQVVSQNAVPGFSRADLELVLASFIGTIRQIPPRFSALKKDGQRYYDLARHGDDREPEARTVTITELELLEHSLDQLQLRIVCSKGVYIRSLLRDIAHALHTAGFVRMLRRTRIGDYHISHSLRLDDATSWITGETS